MKYQFYTLPVFADKRGKLASLEFKEQVPFEPKRIYYVFENKSPRGGHAHIKEKELFICINGSFTAKIHDSENWHIFYMKSPGDALFASEMVWHEFLDFSKDAIMLCLSSTAYDPGRKGYITDFNKFQQLAAS